MDILLAENSPIRQKLLEQKLEQFKDVHVAHAMSGVIRSSVDLYPFAQEDYSNRGNSRLGGLPDLPDDVAYPVTLVDRETMLAAYTEEYGHCEDYGYSNDELNEWIHYPWDEEAQAYRVPMQFIAQLNCAELADLQTYLPREGTLFFFLEQIDFSARLVGRVCYVADNDSLKTGIRFANLTLGFDSTLGTVSARKAKAIASVRMADAYTINDQNPHFSQLFLARLQELTSTQQLECLETIEDLCCDGLKEEWQAQFRAFELIDMNYKGFIPGEVVTPEQMERLTTMPQYLKQLIEANQPMPFYDGIASINGFGFSQHQVPEYHAALALGGGAEDYMVLLKVAVGENHDPLNFIIHRDDLAAQKFDHIYAVFDY
ncbi:DUF1963 domain-containing protein [Shewanella profunda]|uniref:DUF1963 domain-containing protein n=1 Tax=Shewanella profunda TaxID=254793 RepID=UPI00200ED418|nr:DUF1963 domain-containing protein [Shewanella profunda]MCL1091809.1 DUF1963 domain-containing protein [Shewanella profunda]